MRALHRWPQACTIEITDIDQARRVTDRPGREFLQG